VVAKQDIAARTRVTADMVEVKLVPADTVGESYFADAAQVVGQVTRFPITANQQVLASQVIPPAGTTGVSRALSYTIPEGKRGLSVGLSSVAAAGGLILPGDYVDVLVVYDVKVGQDVEDAFLVETILQNIEVLAIQQTIVDTVGGEANATTNGQRARNTEAAPIPEAQTITLLVTPEQAQQVYLAEANGMLRFSLRSYGDGTEKPIEFLTELDLIPGQVR
jgi:pilus assembly protein CpaB